MDVAEAFHEIGESHVTVGVLAFGHGYTFVIVYVIVSRKLSYEVKDSLFGTVVKVHQAVGDHKRSCIDEGVARDALLMLQLHERVEGVARGFPAYGFPQFVPETAYDHCRGEDFGDTLY